MDSNLPKISIIIPVYNVEDYLRECLDSLVNQTFSELEFICVNDGSTDKSLYILNEYAGKDSRFVIISQENQGQGVARNVAIDLAKGETIMFVDPDDFIELNTCEILYKKYKEFNVEVISFNYELYRKSVGLINKRFSLKKLYKKFQKFNLYNNKVYSISEIKNMDFNALGIAVWMRFYSAKFIKENNIRFAPNKHGEDHIFTLKTLMLAKKMLHIDKIFYHYRERIGSAVNKISKDNFCIFDNINIFRQFLIQQALFEKYNESYLRYIVAFTSFHYVFIPQEYKQEYIQRVKESLANEEYFKDFLNMIKVKNSFWENIFSLKNKRLNGQRYKYIKILGIEFLLNNVSKK